MLKFRKNKGITLVALIVTIVILIILSGVLINVTLGNNGIIAKAKNAAMIHKKAQYFEEINIEIAEEQMERQIKAKDEAFIESLNYRLIGKEQASTETNIIYPRKTWVENTIMCDKDNNTNSNPYLNTILIVETKEGYELYIQVDNENQTAEIMENSFAKIQTPYKITYDANGGTGSVEGPTTVRRNFKIKLPQNGYEREKYNFAGWCEDAQGNGDIYAAGSEIRIEKDTTLYAIWSLNIVTITYDSHSGTGTMDKTDVTVGEEIQLPTIGFEKSGYLFEKWTTKEDGSGNEYADGAKITTDADITLYAQWTIESYNITYSLNAGTLSGEKTTYTIEDSDYTLPTPERTGYEFEGWTGSNGDTKQTSVTIEKGSTGHKAYTANWKVINYSITYILNSGTLSGQKTTYTIEDSDYTLPTPSRSGYLFTGWTGSNGDTKQTSVTIAKGSTGEKKYTANWSSNTYTVIFNSNTGSGSMSRQTITRDTATALSANKFTKSGKVFWGWATSSSASDINYWDEGKVNNLADAGGSITLYAIWGANSVKVSVCDYRVSSKGTKTSFGCSFYGGSYTMHSYNYTSTNTNSPYYWNEGNCDISVNTACSLQQTKSSGSSTWEITCPDKSISFSGTLVRFKMPTGHYYVSEFPNNGSTGKVISTNIPSSYWYQ